MNSLESSDASGRRSHVSVGDDPIDTRKIVDDVRADSCGAISTFEGTTRDNFGGQRSWFLWRAIFPLPRPLFTGKSVLKLEYEAYVPMALKEMMKLCNESRELWPELHHISMQHRLGEVPVRESSILIAVSSPHRRDAIAACEWLIDELKARVPVWKKEHYADGSVWKVGRLHPLFANQRFTSCWWTDQRRMCGMQLETTHEKARAEP